MSVVKLGKDGLGSRDHNYGLGVEGGGEREAAERRGVGGGGGLNIYQIVCKDGTRETASERPVVVFCTSACPARMASAPQAWQPSAREGPKKQDYGTNFV